MLPHVMSTDMNFVSQHQPAIDAAPDYFVEQMRTKSTYQQQRLLGMCPIDTMQHI